MTTIRKKLACQACTRRKVRCDQVIPCQNCIRRGDECTRGDNASDNSPGRAASVTSDRSRILNGRAEESIEELKRKVAELQNQLQSGEGHHDDGAHVDGSDDVETRTEKGTSSFAAMAQSNYQFMPTKILLN
jgi:hypothetical protein